MSDTFYAEDFTPPRSTLLYADALYLASLHRAFTLTSGHVPTLFLFSSEQLVSQKLKIVTIDANLSPLLTIVET